MRKAAPTRGAPTKAPTKATTKSTTSGAATRPPRARRAPQARERILAAARELIRERGYERVALADIGDAVGLTRGAILYHYHSKADLSAALLEPFVRAQDELLDRFEASRPRPAPSKVLEAVLDDLLDAPGAIDLLMGDISGRHALALNEWAHRRVERLIALLVPGRVADPAARVRALAALGALNRPVTALPAQVARAQRRVILAAARGALGRPRTS